MTQPDRLALLERLIQERNDKNGKGGAASIAREFGVSDSLISGVRKGNYPGDAEGFLERVAERYGREMVWCPACHEEIPLGRCAENRRRPLVATNPWLRQLWRACRQCETSRQEGQS